MKKIRLVTILCLLIFSVNIQAQSAQNKTKKNMSNYSPTLEYNALMDAYRTRKFTKNDIKSFVYKIFSMYERAVQRVA